MLNFRMVSLNCDCDKMLECWRQLCTQSVKSEEHFDYIAIYPSVRLMMKRRVHQWIYSHPLCLNSVFSKHITNGKVMDHTFAVSMEIWENECEPCEKKELKKNQSNQIKWAFLLIESMSHTPNVFISFSGIYFTEQYFQLRKKQFQRSEGIPGICNKIN